MRHAVGIALAWAALCGGAAIVSAAEPATSPAAGPDLAAPATHPSADHVHARPLDQAIADGCDFLLARQNPNGSWGNPVASAVDDLYISVPGSHDTFKVASTALCVMALKAAGNSTAAQRAHDRGVEFLLTHSHVKRDTGVLIYNFWAHTFVIQALAAESYTNKDPRVADAIRWQIDRLSRYESETGGWNYYDFGITQQPAGGSTSFCAGAGLLALHDARRAGFDVNQKMIDRALRRLADMRQPHGGYLYDMDLQYYPLLPADTLKGSIWRAQVANLALHTWKPKALDVATCAQGLKAFNTEHTVIEMGRKTVVPHSSWFQISGYYFYFDHYYAARLATAVGGDQGALSKRQIKGFILPLQEPDGSWWDYPMWGYDKPYGTALALLTLQECRS